MPVFGVLNHVTAPAIPPSVSIRYWIICKPVVWESTPYCLPLGFRNGILPSVASSIPRIARLAFSQFCGGFCCGDSAAAIIRNKSRFNGSDSSGI